MQLHAFQERQPRYVAMYPHEVMHTLQGYTVRGGPLWYMEAANHFFFFLITLSILLRKLQEEHSVHNNSSNKDQFHLMLNSIKYRRTVNANIIVRLP